MQASFAVLFHTTQYKKKLSFSSSLKYPEQFIKSILRFHNKLLSLTITYINQYFLFTKQAKFNCKTDVTANTT